MPEGIRGGARRGGGEASAPPSLMVRLSSGTGVAQIENRIKSAGNVRWSQLWCQQSPRNVRKFAHHM